MTTESSVPGRQRIVIIGGGFAGLLTAHRLAHSGRSDLDITLVDAKDYFLFTPRLIDALGSIEEMRERFTASLPDSATREGFAFLKGFASHIDQTNKSVSVATGTEIVPITYDILLLCQGGKTAYYKILGAEENSVTLKTWDDIGNVHSRLAACIRAAANTTNEDERRAHLSFVVVGGGPSGIEGAFSIQEYINEVLREHAGLRPFVSYTLLQAAPQILAGFPPKIVNGAMKELQSHGYTVRISAQVSGVEKDAVRLASGERLPAALTLWVAGVEPNLVPMTPDIDRDPRGCIVVANDFSVSEHIFAAGDAVVFRDKQVVLPKNAQTAMHMARVLSENVLRTIEKQPLKPFRYHGLGSIITLGQTGYINLGHLAFKTRLAIPLRDLFYRYRQKQILG